MKPNSNILADAPKYDRLAASRGARARVDRTGGRYGAGMIRGVSVITLGEALGHRQWVDAETLRQTAAAINASTGVKSRFTHPSVSGDGLGTLLGSFTGPATVEGGRVVADLHFLKSAHETPEGDLAKYVMDLADESPESFGASIVFTHDVEAEDKFEEANLRDGKFQSPDPENANHYPHIRLKKLRGVDAVDSPAANPKGLFSRGQEIPADADALLSYALGLTTERPETSALSIDADRAAAFLARFLESRGLTIGPEEQPAPTPVKPALTPSRFADVSELAKPLARAAV